MQYNIEEIKQKHCFSKETNPKWEMISEINMNNPKGLYSQKIFYWSHWYYF